MRMYTHRVLPPTRCALPGVGAYASATILVKVVQVVTNHNLILSGLCSVVNVPTDRIGYVLCYALIPPCLVMISSMTSTGTSA